MRIRLIAVMFIFFLIGCTCKKKCNLNFKVKVDTNKPYNVNGSYCIEKSIRNENLNDSVLLNLHVFDRITGAKVKDGIVRFNNNSSRVLILNGTAFHKVKAGYCNLGVSSITNLAFTISNLKFKSNTEIIINIYLGNSMVF